jgi:hypothetical protein
MTNIDKWREINDNPNLTERDFILDHINYHADCGDNCRAGTGGRCDGQRYGNLSCINAWATFSREEYHV